MRILGFDWDDSNIAKLESHDLEPDDVEALFASGSPFFFAHPRKDGRWIALGFVPDGRFVLAPFDYEPRTRWVRVVTGYEPTSEIWWRIYAKAKGIRKG